MNNTVVITGGAGVLCSTFGKALAKCGYNIALIDLNREAVNKVAEEIISEGGNAKGYVASVLSKSELEEVRKQIHTDFGKCKILINGAGGNSPRCTTTKEYYECGDEINEEIKSFFNLEKEDFQFVFDLNLMGTLLPTQIFVPDMINTEGCSVINISSMNAFRPLTKIPAYSAAKSAVSNFTQWLSVHFAKQNIRVNAIAPGFFVTNQNRSLLFTADGTPTERTKKILNATPMGRFGTPEELIGTLLWLCDSKSSGFVTGIVVPVDGGFSAYSGV